VETSWTTNIFTKPGTPLYNIKTDCADASYAMRIYFSYLNKLPFKMLNNPKNGKGTTKYLSNDLNNFDKFGNTSEKRLIAFLKYIMRDVASTSSLANDTYPIAINRNSLRPGIVYVSPNDHSLQISSINKMGIGTSYSSTSPAAVRELSVTDGFPFFIPEDFSAHKDGYRAFKQPHQYELDEKSLPNYSLEQYDIAKEADESVYDFIAIVQDKMKDPNAAPESFDSKIKRIFTIIRKKVDARVAVIQESEKIRDEKDTQVFSESETDTYSTYSRDAQLSEVIIYLKWLANSDDFSNLLKISQKYNEQNCNVNDPEASSMTACSLKILTENICWIFSAKEDNNFSCPKPSPRPNKILYTFVAYHTSNGENEINLHLKHVWQSIRDNKLKSNPNVSIFDRWNMTSQSMRVLQD
jgi:hypothetical protein